MIAQYVACQALKIAKYGGFEQIFTRSGKNFQFGR